MSGNIFRDDVAQGYVSKLDEEIAVKNKKE